MNLEKECLKKRGLMKSHYDPSRDTVGKIYRDANLNSHEDYVEIGDLSRELTTSLIEDINENIHSFDKRKLPYYLMVHEKKDLQMKKAILRRIIYFLKRPYPEDDTTVFWKDPATQVLRFCWCLPHWSEMDLILANSSQFAPEFIYHIKSWRAENLEPFGFIRTPDGHWDANFNWEYRKIPQHPSIVAA